MAWDGLIQQTGKYCFIRPMEYPKFHSGILGRMDHALGNLWEVLRFDLSLTQVNSCTPLTGKKQEAIRRGISTSWRQPVTLAIRLLEGRDRSRFSLI